MNPKIMKRPMFRMGGPARVNYQNGTTLEELIKKRGELRGKQFDTIRQTLPLSVLALFLGLPLFAIMMSY